MPALHGQDGRWPVARRPSVWRSGRARHHRLLPLRCRGGSGARRDPPRSAARERAPGRSLQSRSRNRGLVLGSPRRARRTIFRIVHLLSWTLIDWARYVLHGRTGFPAPTHHGVTDRARPRLRATGVQGRGRSRLRGLSQPLRLSRGVPHRSCACCRRRRRRSADCRLSDPLAGGRRGATTFAASAVVARRRGAVDGLRARAPGERRRSGGSPARDFSNAPSSRCLGGSRGRRRTARAWAGALGGPLFHGAGAPLRAGAHRRRRRRPQRRTQRRARERRPEPDAAARPPLRDWCHPGGSSGGLQHQLQVVRTGRRGVAGVAHRPHRKRDLGRPRGTELVVDDAGGGHNVGGGWLRLVARDRARHAFAGSGGNGRLESTAPRRGARLPRDALDAHRLLRRDRGFAKRQPVRGGRPRLALGLRWLESTRRLRAGVSESRSTRAGSINPNPEAAWPARRRCGCISSRTSWR